MTLRAASGRSFGGSYTWATLPTASSVAGTLVLVTDVGLAPGSIFVSDGTRWRPETFTTIGRSAVAVSVTGTTNETTLATVSVPAGAMGLDGGIHIYSTWSMPSSANAKTLRTKYGGAAFVTFSLTTSAVMSDMRRLRNRNSASSQVASTFNGTSNALGISGAGAASTTAIDSSVAQDVVFTGQLALGTETLTLENYEVWLVP